MHAIISLKVIVYNVCTFGSVIYRQRMSYIRVDVNFKTFVKLTKLSILFLPLFCFFFSMFLYILPLVICYFTNQ